VPLSTPEPLDVLINTPPLKSWIPKVFKVITDVVELQRLLEEEDDSRWE
jgi:hypothetical protein